jgi:hypothetical protein
MVGWEKFVDKSASALESATLLMGSLPPDYVRHHNSEYVHQHAPDGVADIARNPSW